MAKRSHSLEGGESQSKYAAAAPGVVEGTRALVATGSTAAEPGHCKELRWRARVGNRIYLDKHVQSARPAKKREAEGPTAEQ